MSLCRTCQRSLLRLALAIGVAGAAAACAPDSVRSMQATGFNGYFRQLPTACQPLIIGSQDVGDDIRMNNTGAANYPYFIDVTSRLYYRQLTPEGYRQAVIGFYGPGSQSEKSIDCIIRTLPADRPTAPVGTY
jgi:hypothetical protein